MLNLFDNNAQYKSGDTVLCNATYTFDKNLQPDRPTLSTCKIFAPGLVELDILDGLDWSNAYVNEAMESDITAIIYNVHNHYYLQFT